MGKMEKNEEKSEIGSRQGKERQQVTPSRNRKPETGNRKPPRQGAGRRGAAAGDPQPKPETGNRKPEILVSGFETGMWFRFWFGPCPERSPCHNWLLSSPAVVQPFNVKLLIPLDKLLSRKSRSRRPAFLTCCEILAFDGDATRKSTGNSATTFGNSEKCLSASLTKTHEPSTMDHGNTRGSSAAVRSCGSSSGV